MSDRNSDWKESSQKEYEDKVSSKHYRRDCLQYLGGSLLALGGISRVFAESSGPEKPIDEGPEPYSQTGSISGDPSSNVYFTAPTEFPLLVSKVEQYNENRDPDFILHPAMQRQLEKHDSEEINLLVRTIGERIETTSNGTPERNFFGFRCTSDEVSELAKYGEVVSTPQFATTKLSLHNVNVDKLEEIANLPFVLEVNYEPTLTLDPKGPDQVGTSVHIDDLRKENYHRYSEIDGDWEISNAHKIGYIDSGYRGEGHGPFEDSYAEQYGFVNESLANDFHSGWDDPDPFNSGLYHGDASMDLGAYMLGRQNVPDSVESPMVPLYVYDNSIECTIIRDAIRFAMKENIPVISASWGTENVDYNCPSIFCDLLLSYNQCGGIFVSSAGNDDNTHQVDYPGGEYLSIGVGAVNDEKTRYGYDYERASYSNYGEINLHQCTECYKEFDDKSFSPNVYGYGPVRDDNWDVYRGTSSATAQVGITALMMKCVQNSTHKDVVAIFDSMDRYKIFPDDAAQTGQFNDAEYAYKKSPHKGSILGDANDDGEISIRDSTLIQQELVGMEPDDIVNNKGLADVEQTGEISIRDSTLIKQHLVGMDVETDLKLNSIDVDESNPPPGATIEITAELTNDNEEHEFGAVGPVVLRYDRATSNWQTHSKKWIDLQGGESQTYQFSVNLPRDILTGEECTFAVVAGGNWMSTSVTIAPAP